MRKDIRLSQLFRTASDKKLGGAQLLAKRQYQTLFFAL